VISGTPVSAGYIERHREDARIALVSSVLTLNCLKRAVTFDYQVILSRVRQWHAHGLSSRNIVLDGAGDCQVAFLLTVHFWTITWRTWHFHSQPPLSTWVTAQSSSRC
jgi:hypothetical protein